MNLRSYQAAPQEKKPAFGPAPTSLLPRWRTSSGAGLPPGLGEEARQVDPRSPAPAFDPAGRHEFQRIPVYAPSPAGRMLKTDGKVTVSPPEGMGEIRLDAPIPDSSWGRTRQSSRPGLGGGTAARRCPTAIRVAELFQAQLDASNVANGFRTGFGGVARMEVSDPGGQDWAGTAIHENILSETNSCEPGTSACPNTGGAGGAAGSTWNVGEALSSTNLGISLPSVRNSFYDLHLLGLQYSILHQQHLTSCEQVCAQRFDCGGHFFGPTFEIRRSMTPDQITSGGNPVDVTQVSLEKPEKPGPGDYPEHVLPEGMAYA